MFQIIKKLGRLIKDLKIVFTVKRSHPKALLHNLLPEEVGFVEEDDERLQLEELVVDDGVEQLEAVVHPIGLVVLC